MNEIALKKLQRYCAYSDRCHNEVRTKLIQMKVYGNDLEQIMAQLIEDGYLNEERYARSYCTGKHRINKWGRGKIIQGLKARRISPYCIKKGIQAIEDDEYFTTLSQLLRKKLRLYKIENTFLLKQKLIKYAMDKGYSYEEFQRVKDSIFSEEK